MSMKCPLDQDLAYRIQVKKHEFMGKRSMTNKELSELLGDNLERSSSTANKLIMDYDGGFIFGTKLMTNPSDEKERFDLRRFAIYLRTIGVKERDPLLKEIREYDPRFVYSKLSSQKPKKKYDQASGSKA